MIIIFDAFQFQLKRKTCINPTKISTVNGIITYIAASMLSSLSSLQKALGQKHVDVKSLIVALADDTTALYYVFYLSHRYHMLNKKAFLLHKLLCQMQFAVRRGTQLVEGGKQVWREESYQKPNSNSPASSKKCPEPCKNAPRPYKNAACLFPP